MNILFLAPRLPLPADTGGKIRTLNILKQIAKFAQVHLVSFSFEAEDKQYARDLEKTGIVVKLVPMEDPSLLRKAFDVLVNPSPYSVGKYYSRDMEKALTEVSAQTEFDAVHIDHLHMAHYLKFHGIPMILDEHNVEYKILERCIPVATSPFKRLVYLDQSRKMKRFEGERAARFARCFTVSEDDKKFLEEITGLGVTIDVVPNGVDTEYFNSQAGGHAEEEEAVVFTGSMDWLPNQDAVFHFCNDILPRIKKAKPNVRFYVVGKNPPEDVEALAIRDPRVVVTGRVDDVRPVMAKSPVFVVPIRVGGGTRLKILEAMSMERAVVSTTLGAEGITYTNGHDIVIADHPQAFADAVVKMLDNSTDARELGKKARNLVCSFYDWNYVGQKLKTIYQEVTGAR